MQPQDQDQDQHPDLVVDRGGEDDRSQSSASDDAALLVCLHHLDSYMSKYMHVLTVAENDGL